MKLQAWGEFRSHNTLKSNDMDKSFSKLKTNFRTVLKKCNYFEEMKEYNRLDLQYGNFKVFKVLSPVEIEG